MHHSSVPRSSRSSHHSLAPSPAPTPSTSPAPSSSLSLPLSHQQHPHILYGSITTLQPCTAPPHPSCAYPTTQRANDASSSAPLQHSQGKSTKWHGKVKVPRGQQWHAQNARPAHFSYTGKPLVLFDQTQTTTPASSSFLVSSSTFAHGQFSPMTQDHYNNTGVALMPPLYFKPPELQTFCLVQDRQQPPPQPNSYYNLSSTNACNLQPVNASATFQPPTLTPYAVTAFSNNQITAPIPVQTPGIFQASPIGLVFAPPMRDKQTPTSSLVSSSVTTPVTDTLSTSDNTNASRTQNHDWLPTIPDVASTTVTSTRSTTVTLSTTSTTLDSARSTLHKPSCAWTSLKVSDDRYSDESSTSFDFTIEAEKMVSALCSTTSTNDLSVACDKEDEQKHQSSFFNGAGDTFSNKGTWFSAFGINYPIGESGCSRSAGTQTQNDQVPRHQLPELVRKTAYWGCSEAESILESSKYQEPKGTYLSNVSSATRTAITKSSTCFPIFAGDGSFVLDLINALLRITNGWLVLDNYLNKQHYPNLTSKYDPELTRCFQDWQESTYELLRNVVQTFLKLDKTDTLNSDPTPGSKNESCISFPGDVSSYTNVDLFAPKCQQTLEQSPSGKFSLQGTQEYGHSANCLLELAGFNSRIKETKPRSRLTMTDGSCLGIDGTKSVPDIGLSYSDSGIYSGRIRAKSNTTKSNSGASLTAELDNLRNKVEESNCDAGKQWSARSKKRMDFPPSSDVTLEMETIFNSPSYNTTAISSNVTYDNFGTAVSSHRMEPIFQNTVASIGPVCFTGTSLSKVPFTEIESVPMPFNFLDRTYLVDPSNPIDATYVGKSLSDRSDQTSVPKNRMTLLSQIEPNVAYCGKRTEEVTANLTAWFASMRNTNPMRSTATTTSLNGPSENLRTSYHQDVSRSALDLSKQMQIDANRQLHTLQNMQSIQSSPWNACNLINGRTNPRHVDEYESSEDARVYMKPGSYNVPKKRHQKRSNSRRNDESSTTVKNPGRKQNSNKTYSRKENGRSSRSGTLIKLELSATPLGSARCSSLDSSTRTLTRVDSSSSQNFNQDTAWKAACASAEILLEALNVRDEELPESQGPKISSVVNSTLKCQTEGVSSCEASEDDSESTRKLSSGEMKSKETKHSKTNVKTDSWLIRTLNNANKKHRRDSEMDSSESLISSTHEDEANTADDTTEKTEGCSKTSQQVMKTDSGDVMARATYSETVRRCTSGTKESCKSQMIAAHAKACSSTTQYCGRKCQRKENQRSIPGHKSRKSAGRRGTKDNDHVHNDGGFLKAKILKEEITQLPAAKSHSKKKDASSGALEGGKTKSGDRGWSVWYSSRRRQSLSPLASTKLESIRQTVWQMEEAEMVKYPPTSTMAVQIAKETLSDYFEVIKSPMFLETIGYKLKNRIYHKVEHVIRDFRRIVYNSRLYHKHDAGRLANVETLSRKLEHLFKEHFKNWDFDSITGSPRDGNGSPNPSRHKLSTTRVSRCGNAKKSSVIVANTENGSTH